MFASHTLAKVQFYMDCQRVLQCSYVLVCGLRLKVRVKQILDCWGPGKILQREVQFQKKMSEKLLVRSILSEE